jgi:polysaccharide chain length determinant protein (PEP-CTERM system associated)
MIKKTDQINLSFILDIILRRRWLLIIPFCFSMIVGIYFAIALPKTYEASTLIMVQPQEVPKDYVRSIVTMDIDARINNIAQLITSRTNLEKLITRFNLFSEPKYDKLYMEDKAAMLSTFISVKPRRSSMKSGSGSFTVSFQGSDPEKVLNVANALAAYVIDENLRTRESNALGTTSFLNEELDAIRQKLMDQENGLNQYRQKHMGDLPEQLDSNLKILQRLHEQLNSAHENIRSIKNNIAALKNALLDNGEGNGQVNDGDAYANIIEMKKKLQNLRLRYTDQHPDIIRLKKMIEDISSGALSTEGSNSNETPFVSSAGNDVKQTGNPSRLSEMEREQDDIQNEINKLNAQIALYQKRIENTPQRELELISLERDYDNIKKTYNSMLSRKLESEISVNLERKQKGEQLYIIDHARLPHRPISPDMNRIFLFAVAAGLCIGGGIIYLMEFLDNSLKTVEDIESGLKLPVLAILPTVLHPRDIFIKRANNIASVVFLVVATVLLAGFSVLTFKGVDDTVKLINRII